jgi:hypothetical protein
MAIIALEQIVKIKIFNTSGSQTLRLSFLERPHAYKNEVLAKGSFKNKDGTNVRFWDDTWVGDKPLKVQYPNLYNIVRDPHTTVSKVVATSALNISFRRVLVDDKLRDWLSLVAQISHVELAEGSDYFK